MDKRERCIQHLKERNRENRCKPVAGNGTKRCPNAFAVCTHSVSKAKVADSELEEAGRALGHIQEIDL